MKVLMVMAHPDDEVIFGWPILLHPEEFEVSLLVLCENSHKGTGPMDALKEVCEVNNVSLLGSVMKENNFYRLPTREAERVLSQAVSDSLKQIQVSIDKCNPDALFTHNPWGEYGHGDHRFCFNLVSMFSLPLLMADTCFVDSCHLSSDSIPNIYKQFLFTDHWRTDSLDTAWYERMQAIYQRHRAWTWSGHDPIVKTNLRFFG